MIVYYTKHKTRNFHILLDNIATYLKNKKNAEVINEPDQVISIGDDVYKILDCELLIYYPDRDKYVGLTFADYHSQMISFFIERNKPGDLLLCSQYGTTNLYNHTRLENFKFNFTWKPSIYLPSYPYISLDDFYQKRQLKHNLIDKFFFRGNTSEYSRTSARILQNTEWFDGPEYVGAPEDYFDYAIDFKVGLAIPGTGELCYRDIEYMALGIPFIKIKYVSDLNPPLIPNFHYICIDRFETEEDFNFNGSIIALERTGGEKYVAAYLNKFLEVKDDSQFLNFIAKNARKYYETYLHPLTKLNYVLDLLEINTSI